MSKEAIKWARALKLRGSQNRVLLELALRADDERHSCYPGQDVLAEHTGTSISTVRRAVEKLVERGLVRVERRFDRYGHRTSDLYWLQLDATESEPAAAAAADPVEDTKGVPGSVDNPPTGQNDHRSICSSLPVNLLIPTGQSDRLLRDEQPEEQPGEQPGGASARPPGPTCGKHPLGTPNPCRACGDARRTWDAWLLVTAAEQTTAAAASRAAKYPPEIFCPHLQLRTSDCDACAQDARSALREAGFELATMSA